MSPSSLVITVDGTAGSGKSTLARKFAHRWDALYLNSGLLYRSIGYRVLQEGIEKDDEAGLREIVEGIEWDLCRTDRGGSALLIDGRPPLGVLNAEEIAGIASELAILPTVRERCTSFQREVSRYHPRVVLEGRDGGTVVFPDAHAKWYVDAPLSVRAHRRLGQLRRLGLMGRSPAEEPQVLKIVADKLLIRDTRDQSRSLAPQRPAPDAILIDTSVVKQSDTLQSMQALVEERCGNQRWIVHHRTSNEEVEQDVADITNDR